ncbi:hypothetical protein A9Q83_16100 [Alphaproteobacteria bacterium 46_93_T64]|nr:hypothetical protein A9Q83_16100 [Alphaproteobacteria bacterium 46_93_T64]
MSKVPSTLLIACGALANEATAILKQEGLAHVELTCLPAKLHNTPALIPDLLRAKIRENKDAFSEILVLYGDCGTAGGIDHVLEEEGARRIDGAHCYEFYSGARQFAEMFDEHPGTFYLTDFLVRHFDRLVWQGLGLDRHPELLPMYFGNYTRVIYLAQLPTPELISQAKDAAVRLGLNYEILDTGLNRLEEFISSART